MKRLILGILIGIIITTSIGVMAVTNIVENGNEVIYDNTESVIDATNIQDAIDELYGKVKGAARFCKLTDTTYGSYKNIGSKYECTVGYDSNDIPIKYNFYILAVNNDNTVELIMDRNITQGTSTTTMTWNDAMAYISNNNLKDIWTNVIDINLPSANTIAKAVEYDGWVAAENNKWWCFASKEQDSQDSPYCNTEETKAYNWLYDYTRNCNGCTNSLSSPEATGYWTSDLTSNTASAWRVVRSGYLNGKPVSYDASSGVRPVITIYQSNIYKES